MGHLKRHVTAAVIATLFLGGCAERSLTANERAFVATVHGPAIDMDRVALVEGAASALLEVEIPPRPRNTCREKLTPPWEGPQRGTFPAFATGETIYFARAVFADDFLADYPERMDLPAAMRLAHELTHVWQWQNRRETGYSPAFAAAEHVALDDPYLTEFDPERPFLDYGWEQQGILVEEFVCCRALDPYGARTDGLARVLAEVFPGIERKPAAVSVKLPWEGVRIEGICG